MFRAIVLSLAAASLAGCAPPPPQVPVVTTTAEAQEAPQPTAAQLATDPNPAAQPEPQVVYVEQPVYVVLPGSFPASAGSGGYGYQSGCGLTGDCGRSALSQGMNIRPETYCTSHIFEGAMDTLQTACY